MEAIVLAGGVGSRLKEVVSDRPKPLANVCGKPFLEILLTFLVQSRCQHIIISVGYKKQMIIEGFGPSFLGVPITYVQEDKPLGTGGAFVQAVHQLIDTDPFLICNGDTYFPIEIEKLRSKMTDTNVDMTMALFRCMEDGRYGRAELVDGFIRSNPAKLRAKNGEYANSGMSLIKSRDIISYADIDKVKFSFEDDFVENIIQGGALVNAHSFDEVFFDIGLPEDYKRFCVWQKTATEQPINS